MIYTKPPLYPRLVSRGVTIKFSEREIEFEKHDTSEYGCISSVCIQTRSTQTNN